MKPALIFVAALALAVAAWLGVQLFRYQVVNEARLGAYVLDRLTGRVWFVNGHADGDRSFLVLDTTKAP